MTVAVPDRTAPPPPWRPPSDPHPLTTASQPLSLCYHGNFSLSFVDDENDVSGDVVNVDDIRSILELAVAEQCAFGVSVKDSSDQDMYPKEVSPSPSPCEEATATYQPCRFKAGVKRKLDFDCEVNLTSLESGEEAPGSDDEHASSEYRDRQRMLEVSLCKMRRMEDPETSLRRCVLINNMTVKLKRELDHHDLHCRTMLPKKRHILRRADTSTIPPGAMGHVAPQTPVCRHESHIGNKFPRRAMDSSDEKMAHFGPCRDPEDVTREHLQLCHATVTSTDVTSRGDAVDGTADDESPSIFGDIDNVFQSLLSCLGEPL